MSEAASSSIAMRYYRTALQWRRHREWWPGETAWTVAVTAVLTQNMRWENAWAAWLNLQKHGAAEPEDLLHTSLPRLERLIRSAGAYRRKARTLKALADFVQTRCSGRMEKLRDRPLPDVRRRLLDIRGIGPETADSILLYALRFPILVVDAYTRRIFVRHGVINRRATYEEIQRVLSGGLPNRVEVFHEFHAQIVTIGKSYCRRKTPRCECCPWRSLLPPDHPKG